MSSPAICSSCGAALPSAQDGSTSVCAACAFALALDRGDAEDAAAPGAPAPVETGTGTDKGRSLGPYRLLEKIGEGGMGEVWRAEQIAPVRRIVAMKVIKPGMDTRQVIGRFEAERQALAMMDHPCISKVFDAGSTPEGRPFFVMEYVPGLPITEHCDRHTLTTAERIALFLEVCNGVQHAHQKAIIHRDLKPTNVLVTSRDGVASPKIIDFGIAKALDRSLTEKTLYTEVGALIGTPEYMSPEQAYPAAGDVDTRADVYALGVILYELLSGALPFEEKELRGASAEEIRRMIREVDPPRPSARLSTLGGERLTETARHRSVDPLALRRLLAGELDWIAMKALEKDRARRYASPGELAADLARYTRHEPVLAGPPSASYRARKFVRRHRFGVAAAAIASLALAGFGVAMAVQVARVEREAEGRRRVSEFLTSLFEVSDPGEARGNTITARELLDRGSAGIHDTLADDPATKAKLMATMGIVYRNLGLYKQAEPLLEDALKSERLLLGEHDREALRVADETGRLYLAEGRTQEAEKLFRETVAQKTRELGAEHVETLRSMSGLVAVLSAEGNHKDAEALCRKTLEIQKRVMGPEHADTLRSMGDLARACFAQGRLAEAEALFRESLETSKRALRPGHPDSFRSMADLTSLYVSQGREKEAEALIRESYELSKRVLGPEHPDTLRTRLLLARRFAIRSLFKESEAVIREVLDVQKRVLGPDHPDTLNTMLTLGQGFQIQGRAKDAEAIFREILDVRRRVLGQEHPDTLKTMAGVANSVRDQGRYKEAESLFRETFEIQKRVLGPEHPKTLYMMGDIASVLSAEGRYREAETLAREALEIQRRALGPENVDTVVSMYRLSDTLTRQRRHPEAEELLRGCVDIAKRTLGAEHPYTLTFKTDLGKSCAAQGRHDEALSLYREVLEIQRRTLGPTHPQTREAMYRLAQTAAMAKKRSEALRSLRDAVENGYQDARGMLEDDALRTLRGDPEFATIVARARANGAGEAH